MPGPMFPKDLLLEGAECEVDGLMAIIRREKRLKSALCCSDANPNDGEAADSGQMVMQVKKKKRKKRSKTSLSSNDKAQEHNNKILQDVRALTAVLDGNLWSGSSIGEAVGLALQKAPEECWPQHEDLETPTIAKATVNLKITDKKRKRIEQELQKVVSTSATLVATKETGRDDDRVWKYVCKRAVLVDPKGHIRTSFSAIKSSPGQPHVGNKKTIVSEVSANGKSIVVTITKEGVVAQDWILRQKGTVFGLDAEWRPSFTKGSEHKVALLQICGESECLIMQMLYLDVIPWALVDFLKDPNILFPGVGVKGDAKKLWTDWGLECNGAVDLTSLAVETLSQPELKHVGLKALANVVIGYEMAKPKRVTMSNWAKPVLDKMQVEYATLDAWVSYAIHQRLVNPPLETGKSLALNPRS